MSGEENANQGFYCGRQGVPTGHESDNDVVRRYKLDDDDGSAEANGDGEERTQQDAKPPPPQRCRDGTSWLIWKMSIRPPLGDNQLNQEFVAVDDGGWTDG